MFKIGVMSLGLALGGVYWMLGAFLSIIFYIFPVTVLDSSQSLQTAQNVQMTDWVKQAAPTKLNVGLDVQ